MEAIQQVGVEGGLQNAVIESQIAGGVAQVPLGAQGGVGVEVVDTKSAGVDVGGILVIAGWLVI